MAARQGGPNPDGNVALANAIAKAKSSSVPNDNIERAIKRGTGEGDEANYEEVRYEGYGPGGMAVLVEALTDNRQCNRRLERIAELRALRAVPGVLVVVADEGHAPCIVWPDVFMTAVPAGHITGPGTVAPGLSIGNLSAGSAAIAGNLEIEIDGNSADRVDFIDEDNAGRVFLGLFEHVADARRPHTDEHFHKVRTGNCKERHARLEQRTVAATGLRQRPGAEDLADQRHAGGLPGSEQ